MNPLVQSAALAVAVIMIAVFLTAVIYVSSVDGDKQLSGYEKAFKILKATLLCAGALLLLSLLFSALTTLTF